MAPFDPKLTLTPRQRSDGKWCVEASGPDSIPRMFGEFFAEWEAKIWIKSSQRQMREQKRPQTPKGLQPSD
jgi:hypothetical protein